MCIKKNGNGIFRIIIVMKIVRFSKFIETTNATMSRCKINNNLIQSPRYINNI